MPFRKRTNIGIIGSGKEWSCLPAVRELGKNSNECHLILSDITNPAVHSRYATTKSQIPGKSEIDFVKKVSLICKNRHVTHIICLDGDMKYLLIKNSNTLLDYKFAFPSYKNYEIAMKKDRSSSFVKTLGIPIPETKRITRISDVESIDHDFNKPLVIKGIRGAGSKCVRYAYTHENLSEYYNEVYALELNDVFADTLPIIQEYIGGPTYQTHGLAQNGDVKIVVPHVKFREWPVSGGISTRAKTIQEPRLVEYTTRIMEGLEWHGEAGIEWKYDEARDDFYFIEMNPRFEGSVDICVKAGVNMLKLLLDIIDCKNVPDNIEYQRNIHYRWFFRKDFTYFFHNPYGIGKLIHESINPKVHGEITLNDPLVFRTFWKKPIREVIHFLRGHG